MGRLDPAWDVLLEGIERVRGLDELLGEWMWELMGGLMGCRALFVDESSGVGKVIFSHKECSHIQVALKLYDYY